MTIIYFATNRNPNDSKNITDFGSEFSGAGLGDLRFGMVEVRDNIVAMETMKILPDDPGLGSRQVFSDIKASMKLGQTDSLIFIHGFNVAFAESLQSAAKVSKFYGELSGNRYALNIFVFSWPSNGKITDYVNDRHDAEASGYAFARGLMKLSEFLRDPAEKNTCGRKINLLAHSMGNYVLRNALQQARKLSNAKPLNRMFDEIILAAADEDSDAFEYDYKLACLTEVSQRTTVYFNNNDLALRVSDHLKGNPDRLGHDGARKPRELPGKVVLVDATDIITGDYHSYFSDDPIVGSDIVSVLQGERSESTDLSRLYVPHANKFRLV